MQTNGSKKKKKKQDCICTSFKTSLNLSEEFLTPVLLKCQFDPLKFNYSVCFVQ